VAKGVVSGGHSRFTLWGTNDYNGASAWVVTTTADAPLVAERVDFYNPMTIRWQVAFTNREDFVAAGENTNRVYVSWRAPTTGNLFHTVVDVACRNAVGQTVESNIVAGIWSDFADRSVLKWDGTGPMRYWGNEAYARRNSPSALDTTAELVAYADGQCGAWQEFFSDTLSLHGISCVPHTIRPNAPFIGFSIYSSLNGQGGSPLERHFRDHAVNSYGGVLYDPSYGTNYPSKLAWEDASVESFGNPVTADQKGVLEVTFTPDFP